MKFEQTGIPGVWLIDIDPHEDERGFFARAWCAEEAAAHGLNPACVQCSFSFNKLRGTLRGMHWQTAPHAEAKWIRCTRGKAWDVALDLRPESPAYGQSIGIELSADTRRMIYIPEGVAHGFQTLENDTELFYQMSEVYVPALARGIRWNDPAFRIEWPVGQPVLSDRDRSYEDFTL
ncbi:MAG: dTDP-4-dehydrorhamnose 3,5-epimerase [Kiritimatiellales bacterium]|nr:dTDP-4-dehydrorhamnose 3,5-epimerase [Kiritimatiellales bacterium]